MSIKISILFVCLTFFGCSGSKFIELTDSYWIVIDSEDSGPRIMYGSKEYGGYEGVIPPSIFGAIITDYYIIVMRHPPNSSYEINMFLTLYYIIPYKYPISIDMTRNVLGPFSKHDYYLMKDTLGINENNVNLYLDKYD